MPRYIVDLQIDAHEWLRFYGGSARVVHARARCGTRLAFPAAWLRGAVRHDGVSGSFLLETDDRHRLRRLAPLSDHVR
ncbi:MAG: DUF2835 family protein [Pseudomonadota bacterium]